MNAVSVSRPDYQCLLKVMLPYRNSQKTIKMSTVNVIVNQPGNKPTLN